MSRSFSIAPASPTAAVAHFAARLSVETDVSDVHADLEAGAVLLVVDTRNEAAWRQGHIPGARPARLPVKEMVGGYEYWVREGLPVRTDTGLTRRPADDLTSPATGVSCNC